MHEPSAYFKNQFPSRLQNVKGDDRNSQRDVPVFQAARPYATWCACTCTWWHMAVGDNKQSVRVPFPICRIREIPQLFSKNYGSWWRIFILRHITAIFSARMITYTTYRVKCRHNQKEVANSGIWRYGLYFADEVSAFLPPFCQHVLPLVRYTPCMSIASERLVK